MKVIIYDSDHPGASMNRCFEESYAAEGPGHSFTVELAKQAKQQGFQIVTADVYLSSKNFEGHMALCITDMQSKRTDELIRRGVIPFMCLSTESPIVARDFYINLRRLAGRFVYAMQFDGTRSKLLGTGTKFLTMHYPTGSNASLPTHDWGGRKLLVLINRNKRVFFSDYSTFANSVRSILSPIKLMYQKARDPWIRSKEIYKDRVNAIAHFSNLPGFELYGKGWDQRIPGFPKSYHLAAKKIYKGVIAPSEKLAVLNRFKFALCFENCVFPGYVTEKIFDCFLAGCIPIYFGAPDIRKFVPQDAFIDFTEFADFTSLEAYITSLPESKARKILDAGKSFLNSPQFENHLDGKIVAGIYDKVKAFESGIL